MGCLSFNSLDRQSDISIYASAKEATKFTIFCIFHHFKFQSTPPRRRRQGWTEMTLTYTKFQSTPPRRRRLSVLINQSLTNHYFNPRLREGGDLIGRGKSLLLSISIHASAKEATIEQQIKQIDKELFQSTPPRRRRPILADTTIFQSTISIHASAKEATDAQSAEAYVNSISIHASAKEATNCSH